MTPARQWAEWKDLTPSPRMPCRRSSAARNGAGHLAGGPAGPANLLDLVRNFVMFETIDGQRTKKVARYQQFVAVGKAIERIRGALSPQRRGGVIHHTQGSGKSLTMVFLATKLRRLPEAENPTLVIVTDRTDLDDQISSQFKRSASQPHPG